MCTGFTALFCYLLHSKQHDDGVCSLAVILTQLRQTLIFCLKGLDAFKRAPHALFETEHIYSVEIEACRWRLWDVGIWLEGECFILGT